VAPIKITIAVFGFVGSHVFLVSAPWYLRMLSVTCYVKHRGGMCGKSVIEHGIASQSSALILSRDKSVTTDGVWLDDRIY
jgi:hypothetical protein